MYHNTKHFSPQKNIASSQKEKTKIKQNKAENHQGQDTKLISHHRKIAINISSRN